MKKFPIMIPEAEAEGDDLIVNAPFDGKAIAAVETGQGEAVEKALATAHALFRDRDTWLAASRRIEILERAAEIMVGEAEALALNAAREGGKPLSDSRVEVARAHRRCERVRGTFANAGW